MVPLAGSACAALQYLLESSATAADQTDEHRQRKRVFLVRQAHSLLDAVAIGLLEWLPVSLVVSYCFTPSVSAQIFKAWHCVPFAYDELQEYSYLAYDLTIRCDGFAEHNNLVFVAWPRKRLSAEPELDLSPRVASLDELPDANSRDGVADRYGSTLRCTVGSVPRHAAE